ncbi:nuclear transport factor 2 family protein [Croceicoccus sp. F390]|uniref:Nuclear transport factor 2 family protein n=1 Tax=Croceicoccus esteveae TaxID=3075597 RepID=A0ABU2ZHU5_9SPHN|nr:nuclear transport factor 2 family protein [Croceicoccus sp. F390]MDT0575955.1 nuclear transport factor 2 family protein [Croceicoccus sp. F390]
MNASDWMALRRSAEIYARGADRRSEADWRAVLADEIEIAGPGFSIAGLEANLASLARLGEMFKATRHLVHNQLAQIDGDRAKGETYSTAEHRLAGEHGDMLLVWAIRYQDEWRREAGTWRFTRRELILDWEELRALKEEPAP